MLSTVQATDLRRRVREVLDQVQTRREPVVVRTYDTPQAVLIPYEDFEAYQEWQTRRRERAAWLAELRAIAADVSARAALSDAQAAALIDEAAPLGDEGLVAKGETRVR
ncbi:MAG: type II toxin-antitoxin system Phd/YefM family antitoxin [Chloroflexi bacterium]|nr:type II toxin-antitoxin system Phd/YefM family antitoxin [Chloroflexota bacterium]MBU1751980.1 type II toxin-antitoxin system Phd/YefM family antitoxin [Chloroflexota bacterium]